MRLRVRVPQPAANNGAPERPTPSPLDSILEERGEELEAAVRAEFEARFGHDLGRIRVHAGGGADAAARQLDARALAVGPHLVFASGEYRPATLDGRRLLAHEIAHAIQGSNALQLGTTVDPDALREGRAAPVRLPASRRVGEPERDEISDRAEDAAEAPGLSSDEAAAEHVARDAAATTTSAAAAPTPMLSGSPGGLRIHRFPASASIRDAAAPLADPLVELIAIDIARALEVDPADASGRTRRRMGRMAEAMRAAVVTRVGELLTPAQRELAAEALTGAAVGPERAPAAEQATAAGETADGRQLALTRTGSAASRVAIEPVDGAEREPVAEATTRRAAAMAEQAAPPTVPRGGVEPGAAGGAASSAAAQPSVDRTDGAPEAREGAEAVPPEGVPHEAAGATEAAQPGAGAGAAPAAETMPEASAAAGTGEQPQPDLTPFDRLESRLAERQRDEAETAREAAQTPAAAAEPPAPVGVMSHSEAATVLEPPVSTVDGETETTEAAAAAADAARPGQTSSMDRVDGALTGGSAPVAPRTGEAPGFGAGTAGLASPSATVSGSTLMPADVPDTPAAPESAIADELDERAVSPDPSAPTANETALAAEPAPPATPELESAVADAGRVASSEAAPETSAVASSPMASDPDPAAGTSLAEPPRTAPVGTVEASTTAPPARTIAGLDGGVGTPVAATVQQAPAAADAISETTVDGGAPAHAAEPVAATDGATEPETGSPAEGLAEGSRASGDCGPDAGGGGGGGGAAVAEPETTPTPDVSTAPPAEAMGVIAQLPPAEMGVALAGVGASAAGAVAADRAQLAAQPPSLERPAGSPQTRPPGAARAVAAGTAAGAARPGSVQRIAETGSGAATSTATLPPAGALPTQGVAAPAVAGGAQGEVTAAEAQALRASVDELPVTDPALAIDAGPAPTVALAGDADPRLAADRRTQVEDRTRVAQEEGQVDAARPLGEQDIYPTVPAETLRAEIPPATAAQPPAAVEAPDEPTAIVAREEHTEEVRAAAATSQGQMVADRGSHEQRLVEGRAAAQQQMDEEVRLNAEQQTEERREARAQVAGERGRWSEEQRGEVSRGRSDADTEHRNATASIATRRRAGDREAATEIDAGNAKAAAKRREAESGARAKRDSGKRESSGVLGWLADRARSFFNALKRGIQAIFDAARTFVRRAIQAAISLARRAIDLARSAIVGLIRAVGDALIAIADRVLAAFPVLRDRFRAAIRRVVDRAVAAVNRLAAALKEGIQRALTALGSLIDGALGLLERAYTAAIDAVAGVVQGAIRAAQAVVQFLGEFAALIRDIAGGPMAWLRNLGASVVDGLKNHVWRVLKCAVKEWFNSKVEAVLGLGRAIFDALRNGGIRFAEIGRMVWDALKAALPGIAIQLAIEKLLSLLVPAASAVMLIIDGLRAAWGAISRIIAAIEAFFRFLRAVKAGNAGRLFATALAAGAIALIDFLSNFLVGRLRGPASGVGGRLSGIAARLGRVGGAVARGARTVGGAVRRVSPGLARVAGRAGGAVLTGARAVGRGVRAGGRAVTSGARAVRSGVARGARAVGRGVVAGGRAVGRSVARVARGAGRAIASAGRAVGRRVAGAARAVGTRIAGTARATVAALARGFPRVAAALRRARAAWQRARARFRRSRERRRQRRQQSAQARLDRAIIAIRPQLERLLRSRVWAIRLRAQLLTWRLFYRVRRLALVRRATQNSIVIANSPERTLIAQVIQAAEPELHRTLVELSEAVINEPAVIAAAEAIMDQRMAGAGRTPLTPLMIPPSPGGAAASRDVRNVALFGQVGVRPRRRAPGGPWTAGRIGRTEIRPEQEWLALAPQYGFVSSDVYLGRSGGFHPGRVVVIGPQSYASLRGVRPKRPGIVESATFALQGGRIPQGLTVPEQFYSASLARVSQVEAGRFSAGLAHERMLGQLAATGALPPQLRHGALSPAALPSAGAAARAADVQSGIRYGSGPGDLSSEGTLAALGSPSIRHDLARAYLARERRLVVEFVYRETQMENAMTDSRASLLAWMRDKFRIRLLEVMMSERADIPSLFSVGRR